MMLGLRMWHSEWGKQLLSLGCSAALALALPRSSSRRYARIVGRVGGFECKISASGASRQANSKGDRVTQIALIVVYRFMYLYC